MNLNLPVYSNIFQGTGFVSVVHIGRKTASSEVPSVSKKQAEQIAAREGLLLIGVTNPEDIYNYKRAKKNKLKRKFAPRAGYQRTSWVHSRERLQSTEW